jgi:ABC-2 type transport system permease protein
MVSCRKVSVSYFLNLLLVIAYTGWAISELGRPVSALQISTFIMMIGFGVVICYSLRFLFATLTVTLQDAGNIQFIWYQLYRLATRPDPIYPQFLRYIVLTVFPVAFFASVPSRFLVEGLQIHYLLISPCLAIGLLLLSNFLWEKALRNYSSASS